MTPIWFISLCKINRGLKPLKSAPPYFCKKNWIKMDNLDRIESLTNDLAHWIEKSKQNKLDDDSIEKATNVARELYENWVYLKFKKLNESVDSDPVIETFKEAFSVSKNTLKKELVVETESYDILEKSETEGAEVSENQTTLIEIIEEIQEDKSINARIAKGQTKESLADKHAKNPIANLEKSIGINQKFSFIKHLFNNDKTAYAEALQMLNSCAGFLEADDYVQNQLKKKYNWDEEALHVIKFIDLVERRYLPH